ncbi:MULTISPECIES: helix-turn-helix domain-containing protein [Ruegeria]|uniref:helix-turn-helix domain-containing protein n=1 Tax=Ruegeria TaxID=97050 RepID=UPI00147A1179|nr:MULTISPECIES: helix-turn-helix domain-containing protein [Ruegeria]
MDAIHKHDTTPFFDAARDEFLRDATVAEARKIMGCGATVLYAMINRKELSAYKIGSATRIRRASLNALRNVPFGSE